MGEQMTAIIGLLSAAGYRLVAATVDSVGESVTMQRDREIFDLRHRGLAENAQPTDAVEKLDGLCAAVVAVPKVPVSEVPA